MASSIPLLIPISSCAELSDELGANARGPNVARRHLERTLSLQRLECLEVHAGRDVLLALPARTHCRGIRVDTQELVCAHERRNRLLRQLRRLPPPVEVRAAARIIEHRPSGSPPVDPPAALVHERVVEPAQQQAVG